MSLCLVNLFCSAEQQSNIDDPIQTLASAWMLHGRLQLSTCFGWRAGCHSTASKHAFPQCRWTTKSPLYRRQRPQNQGEKLNLFDTNVPVRRLLRTDPEAFHNRNSLARSRRLSTEHVVNQVDSIYRITCPADTKGPPPHCFPGKPQSESPMPLAPTASHPNSTNTHLLHPLEVLFLQTLSAASDLNCKAASRRIILQVVLQERHHDAKPCPDKTSYLL